MHHSVLHVFFAYSPLHFSVNPERATKINKIHMGTATKPL
jgi:hypothetical protein